VVSGFVLSEMGGSDGLWELSGTTYIDPLMADNPVPEAAGDGVGPWMLTAQWVTLSIAVMLWPATVSRTLAVKSPTVARRLYLFSTIPFLARRTLPALWGIGAFAFFAFHADLGSEFQDQVDSKNLSTLSAMPLYLAKIIPTGLLGIVTAAMLAAFMSTHDSYLLCWSGVVAQDIVAPLCGGLSDRQRVLVTRVSIVAIGAFLLFWGLWYEVGQELWDYLAITGTVYLSGALPVIVGGLYWKRASSTGALAALACGLMGVCGLSQVIEFINDRLFPDPAGFQVFPAMMMLVTMITPTLVFIPVSLLVPDRQRPDGEQST